jgi:hypothetical protein
LSLETLSLGILRRRNIERRNFEPDSCLGGTFERRRAKVLACGSRFMERRNIAMAMVASEITKY